jgi:hypothetical protein
MSIITGERIQECCDVYCGFTEDFNYNPRIIGQKSKCINIRTIKSIWDNPRIIFCYSKRIRDFIHIVKFLQNNFVLVTHNSDASVFGDLRIILDNSKLEFWHGQNVLISHNKLGSLPIGIANSMWAHGNLNILENILQKPIVKLYDVYFNFSLHTNPSERENCLKKIRSKGLQFMPSLSFEKYLTTLASYKYAICPPGNGVDCHRIWECLYLGVIPILLHSVFSEQLSKSFNCILLKSWDDFDMEILINNYTEPKKSDKLTMSRIKDCINNNIKFF